MDEILENCRNLCSDDFRIRARAYQTLRNSRAFTATMYRFRDSNLTAYDLARLLASGSSDALAKSVLQLLDEHLSQSQTAA
ncbi:MAG TPA: hypothetical protein VG125_09845 [Pirellulales bacterium]|jgi:hypothetical protein|nr:hypothetical protein [Pirellulales bacterium]